MMSWSIQIHTILCVAPSSEKPGFASRTERGNGGSNQSISIPTLYDNNNTAVDGYTMASSPLHRALEIVTSQIPETTFEYYSDAALGVAFLATAIIAAKR